MVGPFPPITGGVTTFMLNVLNSSLKEDFEFVPFTTSRPPKPHATHNWGYGAIFQGGVIRLIQGVLVTAAHLVAFPFRVVGGRIDIVQVQASDFFVFWEATLYVLMAKLLRRPVLLRIGGSFDKFYGRASGFSKFLLRRALSAPDILIVQSLYWKTYVAERGRPEGVCVLNNSVDAGLLEIDRPARSDVPRFLFICNNEAERKGAYLLVEALKLIRERGVKATFDWAATPRPLEDLIRKEGLDDRCAISGFIPHDEALAAMRAADVFLIPSYSEGFPNSLIEAMACGTPAIATPVGAVPEIMEHEHGGLIVPPGDVEALAAAIERLANDPALRKRLGEEAREIVRQRFTAAAVLPALSQAYRALLERS